MRSRATFRSHPVHPALIPFPLAFLVGALAADVAGRALARPELWMVGWHLAAAGVVAGLVAAVPGVIDYRATVPPDSSGKERARKHGLANAAALALFAAAWWIRGGAEAPPGALVLGLQGVGAVLLGMGGWMGGTLVNRNLISVDHRYAGAGKWSEARLRAGRDGRVVAARADELEVDQMKLLHVDGRRIVLGRTEDGYVAFDDRCTHRGGSLAGGVMICGTVQCLWHGSQFDCRTGAVRAGPAEEPIRTYEVEEAGGEVRLRLR
jgi:nitrite reductase/ring-hydroxylating ferredoxin subunit/uncharacterized membrane protein